MVTLGAVTAHGAADAEVQHHLTARVGERIAPELVGPAGPLQRNVFSFVFRLRAPSAGQSGVFVKIPKTDLRRRDPHILPLTDADRALGRTEYDSLRYLERAWGGNHGVRFVRPLAYLDEYNAVVTRDANAAEALALFRRLAVREWLARGRQLGDMLRRFGSALRHFHDAAAQPGHLALGDLHRKIAAYLGHLEAWGAMTRHCATDVLERVSKVFGGAMLPTVMTTTLKGIDVRNILIDAEGILHLVDPGAIKRSAAEADLARFLVTWRIAYWGTWLFAFGAAPSRRTERAFLAGYGTYDERTLRLMLVKETLKHWYAAHDSLRLKPWPAPLRHVVAAAYIDPFYRRQLQSELRFLVAR